MTIGPAAGNTRSPWSRLQIFSDTFSRRGLPAEFPARSLQSGRYFSRSRSRARPKYSPSSATLVRLWRDHSRLRVPDPDIPSRLRVPLATPPTSRTLSFPMDPASSGDDATRKPRRFAPLDPSAKAGQDWPKLKGIIFDVDGTLW